MLSFPVKTSENELQLIGLAAYLHHDGIISKDIAIQSIKTAHDLKITFAQYLVKQKILSSEELLHYCVRTLKFPNYKLDIDFELDDKLGLCAEFVERHRIIPLFRNENFLHIGMTDPTDQASLIALQFKTHLNLQIYIISEDALSRFLKKLSEKKVIEEQNNTLIQFKVENNLHSFQPRENDDETIVNFVDQLILQAISKKVSDIHLEPYASQYRVRFRQDSILHEITKIPSHFAVRIISRIKILANMDISEKRLPQDGHICLSESCGPDIRVSSSPTSSGEKLVLRLFDQQKHLNIDDLGLSLVQKELLIKCLRKPQGLILITGPTGSGKTVTLYSALHLLNQLDKNICTIEDPVEMIMDGVNQMTINHKIGLDFITAIKCFLRHDPDVIMIGEIRDTETALAAFQAAQTGHLVLSTLHTNSAIETILRLKNLNINLIDYMSVLNLIVAQRLVRKLCDHCKIKHKTDDRFIPSGCELCTNGFHGRTGVYELLSINPELIEYVIRGHEIHSIKKFLKSLNYQTLFDSANELVKKGITTKSEIKRVIGIAEC